MKNQCQMSESGGEVFMGVIQTGKKNPWTVSVELDGETLEFQIDTGVEETVISEQIHKRIGSPLLQPTDKTFRGPNNTVIPMLGQFKGKLKKNRRESIQDVFVAEDLHKPLLGQPAIDSLGIVQRIDGVRVEPFDSIVQFPRLFKGLGK